MTDSVIIVNTTPQHVIVRTPGPQGPPGGGAGSGYEHVQSVPSSTWVVNHNLGGYPLVAVIIDDGGQLAIWGAEVVYNSINQLSVLHAEPKPGRAVMINAV